MDDSAEHTAEPRRIRPAPARAELDRLFDMSLDLLCIAGLDGYFKHVNPAFTRALGYQPEDLLRKAFIEFVHPDDREGTLREVERLAQGQDVVDFENRYRAADGSWRWLAWRSTSVPEESLIFAVARDVTDHKLLRDLAGRQAEELARSNADLEQFASIAAHDLQAPLRTARTLADWIEEALPDQASEKAREHLDTLRERIDLMSKLTSDLLAYSRVSRDSERVEATDVAALVAQCADLLGVPDGFEVVAAPGLPVFATLRSPLELVFRNLVANAIVHHDGETGTVTVSARDAGGHWEFSVADDGPGIAEEDRDSVFQMLWSGATGAQAGTGMGLALVRRIVERVGGRVSLESARPRGTVFRFTWPKAIGA